MSSKNNVNPGQYTARGSQRQGEDIVPEIEKNEFAQASSSDQKQRKQQNLIPAAKPLDKEDKQEKAERKSAKKSSAKH